ncbi:MAG: MOSC domain-containing protein [Ectothiorhodospiraceae bacterium]|nr:MOSC domain-containing protein [Ectothiorhodospiraceae bacterium]
MNRTNDEGQATSAPADAAPAGTVARLWRYPVKSMLGERCGALQIGAEGVKGDRRYALRDAEGKLGSGKNTRRFTKMDGLFGFSASFGDAGLEVHFPDGELRRWGDPDMDRALTAALVRTVTLREQTDATHLDAGPVHLLSTASLAWLRAALPDAAIEEQRFRPNLVLDVPAPGCPEQGWIGRRLRVGTAELLITEPTERCAMVTFAQQALPQDLRVLRYIARHADNVFGVYAQVVTPGVISLGERIWFRRS